MSIVNICLAVASVWVVLGLLIVKFLDKPKNTKQSFIIMVLLGPIGWVLFLFLFVFYFIEEIYKKMGE
jgi:hypothetical protein